MNKILYNIDTVRNIDTTMTDAISKELGRDPLVERVIKKMRKRSDKGMIDYGMSMEENNTKSIKEWIEDAQEELMDAVIYLEKLKTIL